MKTGVIIGIVVAVVIVIIIIIIVAVVLLTKEDETPDAPTREPKVITIADAYGVFPGGSSCSGSDCVPAYLPMMAGQCRLMGGTVNGTPSDGTWTDCHINVGKNAPRGLVSSGAQDATCPNCPWGRVQTTGATCHALRGYADASLGDAAWGDCHMNFTDRPGFGMFPSGKCPNAPCNVLRLNMKSADCKRLGGTPSSAAEWSLCSLGVGPL